jgi:hypothetical protein
MIVVELIKGEKSNFRRYTLGSILKVDGEFLKVSSSPLSCDGCVADRGGMDANLCGVMDCYPDKILIEVDPIEALILEVEKADKNRKE